MRNKEKFKGVSLLKKISKRSVAGRAISSVILIFSVSCSMVLAAPSMGQDSQANSESEVLSVLLQIQSQLQTIGTQQSQLQTQLQQAFQGFTQYEIKKDYPSVMFPGANHVGLSSIQSTTFDYPVANNLNSLMTPSPSDNQKDLILMTLRQIANSSLSRALPDSESLSEINGYMSVLKANEGSMNQVQSQRLTNRLLLLNAKTSYLQYREEQRVEALLVSQLYLQAQQSLKQGEKK